MFTSMLEEFFFRRRNLTITIFGEVFFVKKVVLMVSFLFLFSAVGFASPLTDFSQGKASIDINWRPSSNLKYPEGKLDGNNNNFDFGLTIGLGDKFGFQWQNQTAKSKNYSGTITVGGNVLTVRRIPS
jgi:hypothetical protein